MRRALLIVAAAGRAAAQPAGCVAELAQVCAGDQGKYPACGACVFNNAAALRAAGCNVVLGTKDDTYMWCHKVAPAPPPAPPAPVPPAPVPPVPPAPVPPAPVPPAPVPPVPPAPVPPAPGPPVPPAPAGEYKVVHKTFTNSKMDSTDHGIDVWHPVASNRSFPLISYAHGLTAGGAALMGSLNILLTQMASYGYIIVATRACSYGCKDDCYTPPFVLDPPCFGHYYKQQLKAIEWANTQTGEPFSSIDKAVGVGIAGHSMGGQATQFSSSYSASQYNIKAAVNHHPYTHSAAAPAVPFLVFTGTADVIAVPSQAKRFYDNATVSPRGFVNKVGATHFEPQTSPRFEALYTVAWFKCFLDRTPQVAGHDWHAMLFGTGKNSLCHGGDGKLSACDLVP